MDTTPSDDVRQLSIGAALRRGWWIVAGCAVVLGGLAAAATTTGSPTYTSSTSVFLQPIAGNALSPDATVNGQQVLVAMQTEAGLVDSPDVLTTVGQDLGLPEDTLRKAVKATVPSNTKTVRIAFSGKTPAAAEAGAAEFAKAFLAFRQDQADQAQNRQLTKLKAQSAATLRNLRNLSPTGSSSSADRASQQVLASRLASIQASIAELISTDTFPGNVSSAATVPSGPDGFSPLLLIAVAALLGLGAGAVVAVWRHAVDDRMAVDTGAQVAGLPVLSVLHRRRGAAVPLFVEGPGADDAGEGFRQLRIGMTSVAPTAKSFTISHASPAVQTGSAAANLAITMSASGQRIVLVDACAPGTPGSLVEVLGDRLRPGTTPTSPRRIEVPGSGDILVVTTGTADDDAGGVDETKLAQLIRNQTRRADLVLVAGPSLTTADGELASLATDATVLVAEQDRTRTADVQAVLDRSQLLGVQVCGLFSVPKSDSRRRSTSARTTARAAATTRQASTPAAAPARPAQPTKGAPSTQGGQPTKAAQPARQQQQRSGTARSTSAAKSNKSTKNARATNKPSSQGTSGNERSQAWQSRPVVDES